MTTTATEATAPQNNISEVRKMLLDQMAALRNSATPDAMRQEIERGQCPSQIAQVITNTAKVEVDYIKATGQEKNPFLETATTAGAHQPAIATTVQAGPGNGISSITRHTLRG